LISEDSPWGKIEVWQDGTVRYLYIQDKTAIQSQLDMEQKEKLLLQRIAKKYFDASETPQVSIQLADASTYFNQTKQKNVSVILVDVHNGKCLPDFLYNQDFIEQCFQALSSEGMLVINVLVNNNLVLQEFAI